ncbi:MAG: phage holin family protein [Firmicutes bacterium]|nr:phage holin family protein [Bacillota bacterium]
MKILAWLIRFFIPFLVLYFIGYLVPGFSALTISWLLVLALLFLTVEALVQRVIGKKLSWAGLFSVNFLVATAVIFMVTLAIRGGNVPLSAAILAAAIIAVLNTLMGLSQKIIFIR